MKRKLQEFLNLKQGSETVQEYAWKLNFLAQYVSYDTNTDEEKKDCFGSGLSPKLQDRLAQVTTETFNNLMSVAIVGRHSCSSSGQEEEA